MYRTTLAAFALAIATPLFAQDTAPATRGEVKAETKALEKAGKLTPPGEAVGTDRNFKPTKTRAQRKTETKLAAKNHELIPPGPGGTLKIDEAYRSQPSTRSREERKAETRLAEKQGKLIPAGEGPDAPRR